MNKNYLHNSAFVNFSCDCCSQNTKLDNTRFGQWVDSGFKSKKKRDAEAAANLASAGAQINALYGNAPSSSSSDNNTVSADVQYGGSGISSNEINKISPSFDFGSVPSIDNVVNSDNSTNSNVSSNTANKSLNSVVKKYPTNYMAWAVVGVVLIGGGATLYHFVKNGKIKLPFKK